MVILAEAAAGRCSQGAEGRPKAVGTRQGPVVAGGWHRPRDQCQHLSTSLSAHPAPSLVIDPFLPQRHPQGDSGCTLPCGGGWLSWMWRELRAC